MAWDGPLLTDSGGFQGFSLEHLREISEEGILFKSHLDGSMHSFTPEAVVEHQRTIGADIIMPLDVCLPAESDRGAVEAAMERTARWAERSMVSRRGEGQALFGIVQGGLEADLRERSARQITSMGFTGYAVGGLSVGETKAQMYEIAGLTTRLLPADAPRYLMGVGSPEDLVECVARGVDMFDCALPTRVARSGALLTRSGRLNVAAATSRSTDGPVDPECDCYTCRTFSAAYVHHLFRAGELLAFRLATIHNLRFVARLMAEMRDAILGGQFQAYRDAFHRRFTPPDEATRRAQKRKWLQSRAQDLRRREHHGRGNPSHQGVEGSAGTGE
jgi:queuine tRNA-ribosyltransferase